MQYFQVPESVSFQSGLQAPVYQYVHGVSSQGRLERVGKTFGMFDGNFLNVEGSVRAQNLIAQGSSWYYPVNVYPETLTLNKWQQRHNTIDRIQHYPANSLLHVPHSSHSCNNQQVSVTGHVQYPGLTQMQYLPTTELHNNRGQMFYQPTVYVQQQQLPIMNKIPPGHMYPNNVSWTHHNIQAQEKFKPPNARKSLSSDLNTQDASHGSQTAMTILSPKVTPVKNRADVHSYKDSGSNMSPKMTKTSIENIKKRKDSSMRGTLASHTIEQNVSPDDRKHFFIWENKQMDPSSKSYSAAFKPDIFFNKGHTILHCEQLEPLTDSNTLLLPGDICTDRDPMAPTIITGVSSKSKNKNAPPGHKRSATHILGSFANDLLSSHYEDPAVSMLISSMDYLYKVAPHEDIERKKNTPKSTPFSSSNNLAKWYSIFKKRRLCRIKAKTAKHQKSVKPKIEK